MHNKRNTVDFGENMSLISIRSFHYDKLSTYTDDRYMHPVAHAVSNKIGSADVCSSAQLKVNLFYINLVKRLWL